MSTDDEAFQVLCATLREEAGEQIERIGAVLLEVERSGSGSRSRALLDEAFRQAHNLKGAAASLGFVLTSRLAHAMETALSEVRDIPPKKSQALFDLLHRALSVVPLTLEQAPEVVAHPEVTPLIEQLFASSASLRPPQRSGDSDPGAPVPPPAAVPSAVGAAPPVESTPEPERTPADLLQAQPDARPWERTPSGVEPFGEARTQLTREPSAPSADSTVMFQKGEGAKGPSPAVTRPSEESLRVSTKKLGALMAQVGELLAARLRTDQRLSELKSILSQEEDEHERRAALRSSLHDYELTTPDPFVERLVGIITETSESHRQLVRQLRELVRAFEADALQSTILSGELQEDIRRIQTFPLASVLDPLPRAARNMASEAGKQADLVVVGAELELDKKVLESLRDPLYHLLRNAIDHGIEPPADRQAAGKPARATVHLKAEHRGDSISITVSDDGPGIDLDAVRSRAVERGLLSEREATQCSEQQLLELLFAPGFTTRRKVSSLSGRGVGLDAVRTSIEQLHGAISLGSRRGAGTTVTITLPLTIYVVHALVVRVGDHELALPISSVYRIMRLRPSDVLTVEQSSAVLVDGQPIALLSLADLLGVARAERKESSRETVVVVGVGDQRCALSVDEIIGDQTVLAKNLEPPMVRIPNIAGATIRGDGSVLLTLNPIDLLRKATTLRLVTPDAARDRTLHKPRLLLADDSFTTRALERSVLEAAGFEVVAVANGAEALAELESGTAFDALVTDVTMPEVDGFALCRAVRESPRLQSLPVVLVTSLTSESDKKNGLDAGADAYIVKQEFDHEELVALLFDLIGRS